MEPQKSTPTAKKTTGLLCLFCAFILSHGVVAQAEKEELDYGLSFASHEVTKKDQRTALSLNPVSPFDYREDFELRFDLSFRRLKNAYGYIVRIVANDSVNIDLVCSPEHSDFSDLTLVVNNKPTGIHYDFSDVGLTPLHWTPVRIAFSFQKNQIALSWCGQEKTENFTVKDLRNFRFYFGANDFRKFRTSDVPPMILKNVEILQAKKTILKWELKKHGKDEVYDNMEGLTATVKNPEWLIDQHTRWVHVSSFTVGKYPSVAFNGTKGLMYIIDKNGFSTLDVASQKIERRAITHGNPVYTDANQLLYVDETNELINYDYFTGHYQKFNQEKVSWPNMDTAYNQPNYWHNNKFYNASDSAVYTFGGYGQFSYKGNFFKYDTELKKWDKVKTTGTIPPRYLSAAGIDPMKDKLLIFGGYGSVSGKQELSPQSFYDLYTFDLKTKEVKKIRDYASLEKVEDIVFSNSLVVNGREDCFYVLSYPKNKYESFIKLRKYSLSNTAVSVLADSIAFQFHDEHSFCDLFLSSATHSLLAVTAHREKDQYKMDVYSIAYPPLKMEDVLQPETTVGQFAGTKMLFAALLGCGAVFGLYFALRKRKPSTPAASIVTPPQAKTDINHLNGEKTVSSIHLFGGFQVFDKAGDDITARFTMTLEELFVIILLHSVKYEKGISSIQLQEYLWPDKDEVSARNNRNVNIKKLRTFIEPIGGVTIENNNSCLRLEVGTDVFCDYQVVSRILDGDANGLDEYQKIEFLLKNVKKGSLLPNLQGAWLDNFKSDISNKIIDMLLEFSQKLDINKDGKLLLDIADVIFNYDSINQEALVIKCSVLNKKGKYSLAKTSYDHFVKEYKNLYSENYPRTFDEVIS